MMGSKNPIAPFVVAPRIEIGVLMLLNASEIARVTVLRTIVQNTFSLLVNLR